MIQRHVTIGEVVEKASKMFTIADLDTLWVDLIAYPQDFDNLKIGQEVIINTDFLKEPIYTKINYISPFGIESSQTMLARVNIDNKNGILRPGLFANGLIKIDEHLAKITVKKESLQTWENKTVVFVKTNQGFQAQNVITGKSDDKYVEIVAGLHINDQYANNNSFIIKAELGKSLATHDH